MEPGGRARGSALKIQTLAASPGLPAAAAFLTASPELLWVPRDATFSAAPQPGTAMQDQDIRALLLALPTRADIEALPTRSDIETLILRLEETHN